MCFRRSCHDFADDILIPASLAVGTVLAEAAACDCLCYIDFLCTVILLRHFAFWFFAPLQKRSMTTGLLTGLLGIVAWCPPDGGGTSGSPNVGEGAGGCRVCCPGRLNQQTEKEDKTQESYSRGMMRNIILDGPVILAWFKESSRTMQGCSFTCLFRSTDACLKICSCAWTRAPPLEAAGPELYFDEGKRTGLPRCSRIWRRGRSFFHRSALQASPWNHMI